MTGKTQRAVVLNLELARRRWSGAELGRRTGINASTISRFINGKENVSDARAQRIADALGWHDDPMNLFKEVKHDDEVDPDRAAKESL